MRHIANCLALWLIKYRGFLAVTGLILAFFSIERSRHLEFSTSIDSMFDQSDPALAPYHRMARTFGASEVVLAAYDDPKLFTISGIQRLRDLTNKLYELPSVDSATSIATTPLGDRIIDTDSSPTAKKLIHLMEGYAVGKDHRTAAVVCVLAQSNADAAHENQARSRAKAIDAIRSYMASYPSGTVAGEPVMLRDGFAMLQRDGNVLGTTAGLLAGCVLLICFRSIRWVIVPMAVVLLALWSTRGILALSGLQLTMVSTMLSAIVTVVAIATTVHIIIGFRRHRKDGLDPQSAIIKTLSLLIWPIIGAILTDIIGFGALIFSRVGPVHDFGIMTAIGACMVFVSVVLCVPWLSLVGRGSFDPQQAWGERTLQRALDRLTHWIVRHPLPVLGTALTTVMLCIVGMRWLTVETDFTKNFRSSSPIVKSYNMIESRLGGAGVWDILVPVDDTIDGTDLSRLIQLKNELLNTITTISSDGDTKQAITKAMSIADVLEAISPISLDRLEETRVGNWMVSRAVQLLETKLPELGKSLIGTDPIDGSRWLRLMLRSHERQPSDAKHAIIQHVRTLVSQQFPGSGNIPPAEVTGFFVLLSQLVRQMILDQWFTFLIAASGIYCLISIGFRSFILGIVALIPNALPIFFVLGLLGWSGVAVNMGTAMIAAVSMGLSVDSSIHFIAAYRRHLDDGYTCRDAIQLAHRTAGTAMIFSTLALVVGFIGLTTSDFIPTVSFGALSCLTLIGGLLGNLVVLPVLLTLVDPWRLNYRQHIK